MKKLGIIFLSLSLSLSLSLAGITGSAAAYDCSYAEDDIQRLQSEKQSTLERAAKGASAILPIGAALHVLEGNEAKTLDEVGTDDYNRHIDARILQIKETCNLP